MTPEAAKAARRLIASAPDAHDAKAIAAHATAVCQLFSQHLSRLVGDLGMRTLFARSISLAGAAFPCLRTAAATAAESPYDTLRRCLEQETPESALDSAVHVFQTFIQLLERFIGAGLVANLLHEVWPTIFPMSVVKETK